MKRKSYMALLLAMSMTTLATPTMSVFAAESGDVTALQTISSAQEAETEVIINGGDSSFTVSVPKTIDAKGSTGTLAYKVMVDGDIAGNEEVKVVPDTSFDLTQGRKDPVTATVSQDKQVWAANEFDVDAAGQINYEGLSAGTWQGVFNFNINLDKAGENSDADTPETPEVSDPKDSPEWKNQYGCFDVNGNKVMPLTVSTMESLGPVYLCEGYAGVDVNPNDIVSIVVPDGVTTIDNQKFSNLPNVKSIILPDSVTTISAESFMNCPNLVMTIPASVTYIGGSAFVNSGEITLTRSDIKYANDSGDSGNNGVITWHLFENTKLNLTLDALFDGRGFATIDVHPTSRPAAGLYTRDGRIATFEQIQDEALGFDIIDAHRGEEVVLVLPNDMDKFYGIDGLNQICKVSAVYLPDDITYIGYDAICTQSVIYKNTVYQHGSTAKQADGNFHWAPMDNQRRMVNALHAAGIELESYEDALSSGFIGSNALKLWL